MVGIKSMKWSDNLSRPKSCEHCVFSCCHGSRKFTATNSYRVALLYCFCLASNWSEQNRAWWDSRRNGDRWPWRITNVVQHQTGRGHPKSDIWKQYLLQLQFTCSEISFLFCVSLRTIRRSMEGYDLSVSILYSDISDCELHTLVSELHSLFPNCGNHMMD